MKEMLKSKPMIIFIILVFGFAILGGITPQKNTSEETTDTFEIINK